MITRKVVVIALFLVGVSGFIGKKDTDELSSEIASLTEQQQILSHKVSKLSMRSLPKVSSFDYVRFTLGSMGISPRFSSPIYSFDLSSSSLEGLLSKVKYTKRLLPNTYINRMSLDRGMLNAEMKTQVNL